MTSDFSWICPDQNGGNCLSSSAPKTQANLFDISHERSFVDLIGTGADLMFESGVHIPIASARLLMAGRLQLRFLFADNGWTPKNDGFATFNSLPAALFTSGQLGTYYKGTDYSFTVLTQLAGTTFTGNLICYALNYPINYRSYDEGLHMGDPFPGSPCHMNNDVSAVQLKSHYTSGNVNAQGAFDTWYPGQHSLLKVNNIQVPANRIAIWVR